MKINIHVSTTISHHVNMNKKGKNKRGIESKQNDAKFKNWSTTLWHQINTKYSIWCLHQLVKRFKFRLPLRNQTENNLDRKLEKDSFKNLNVVSSEIH